jgi:uncharacterized protein (TIGR02118 family)
MVLLKRRSDLTTEEFRRYLAEVHRPLVLALPGLRRLVMNYPVADPGGMEPPCDAIAEDWFDSPEAMGAAMGSPEGKAIAHDSPNFLDMAQTHSFTVEEDEASLDDN